GNRVNERYGDVFNNYGKQGAAKGCVHLLCRTRDSLSNFHPKAFERGCHSASIRIFNSSTVIRGASSIENIPSGIPIRADWRANGVTPFALAFIQGPYQFLNQRIKLLGVGFVRYRST